MRNTLHALSILSTLALLSGLAPGARAGALGEALADSPARIALQGTRLLAQAEVAGFSDPAPLLRLDDEDWGHHARSRHAVNHAQLDAKLSLGVEGSGWRLSALARRGGTATASADAVQLFALLQRDEAPGAGERFELNYQLKHWRASGLSLGRAWRFSPAPGQSLELGASMQYLNRVQLLHQVFQGRAVPDGAGLMLFEGQNLRSGDLMRTDDPSRFNPFVREGKPRGRGHALDLGARWVLSPQWQLELAGFDLAARLKGRDMPVSVRVGKFLYDAEGQLIGNADGSAAVQGQDSRGDVRMRPRPRWIARLGWQGASWQVDLLGQTHAGVRQVEVAGRRVFESGWWAGASITSRNAVAGLSAGNEWFSVSLASSSLRAGDARGLGAALRLALPLRAL